MSNAPESPRKRYLEDRIVFCANCDSNRLLTSSSHGLVCSTCASVNWMYLPHSFNARQPAPSALEAPSASASTSLLDKVIPLKGRARLRLVG